jgi:hypothetical protein
MPLLSFTKQEPRLAPTVPPPGASEVFVIRCTGECVKSYEEYTAKRSQYALPQWQEKYFNKSGLTYEEALAIERSVEESIKTQVRTSNVPKVSPLAEDRFTGSSHPVLLVCNAAATAVACSFPNHWKEMW